MKWTGNLLKMKVKWTKFASVKNESEMNRKFVKNESEMKCKFASVKNEREIKNVLTWRREGKDIMRQCVWCTVNKKIFIFTMKFKMHTTTTAMLFRLLAFLISYYFLCCSKDNRVTNISHMEEHWPNIFVCREDNFFADCA